MSKLYAPLTTAEARFLSTSMTKRLTPSNGHLGTIYGKWDKNNLFLTADTSNPILHDTLLDIVADMRQDGRYGHILNSPDAIKGFVFSHPDMKVSRSSTVAQCRLCLIDNPFPQYCYFLTVDASSGEFFIVCYETKIFEKVSTTTERRAVFLKDKGAKFRTFPLGNCKYY